MNDINTCTFTGRLTVDSKLEYTNAGTAIASFAIAVNRSRKMGDHYEDEASFLDCKILGKTAENLSQYLTKGKPVAVTGTLKQERWQDRQTGQNRSMHRLLVQEIRLLGDGQKQQSGYDQNESYEGSYGY